MMSNIVLFSTVTGPVTPAMHNGWAPKNEKMKAAMKDESSTSATPYCCVVSMRSREKAIPGRTLGICVYLKYGESSIHSVGLLTWQRI